MFPDWIQSRMWPHRVKAMILVSRFHVYTERKKWSRKGSRVEPFSCPQDGPHLSTVLVQTWLLRKKIQNGSRVETFWLHFFFSECSVLFIGFIYFPALENDPNKHWHKMVYTDGGESNKLDEAWQVQCAETTPPAIVFKSSTIPSMINATLHADIYEFYRISSTGRVLNLPKSFPALNDKNADHGLHNKLKE